MMELRSMRLQQPWVGINIHHQLSIYFASTFHTAALSRAGAEVEMFAPDVEQAHVMDHSKGEAMEETRR